MPIRPQFQPSPILGMSVGQSAGLGEYQKWLREQQLREQQVQNQNRQFNQGLQADFFQQNQRLQYDQQRQMQGAQLENYLAGQAFTRQKELGDIKFGQEKDILGIQNKGRMDYQREGIDAEISMKAAEVRKQLEGLLGGTGVDAQGNPTKLYDAATLNDGGQQLRRNITTGLAELDEKQGQGRNRPRDYYHAVNDLLGKAQGLSSPRFQDQKPPTIQERVESGESYIDDNGNVYRQNVKGDILWDYEAAHDKRKAQQEPPKVWMEPGVGMVTEKRDAQGNISMDVLMPVKDLNAIYNEVEEQMTLAPNPIWETPTGRDEGLYRQELKKRVDTRMELLGVKQPSGPGGAVAPPIAEPLPRSGAQEMPPAPEGVSPEDAEWFQTFHQQWDGLRPSTQAKPAAWIGDELDAIDLTQIDDIIRYSQLREAYGFDPMPIWLPPVKSPGQQKLFMDTWLTVMDRYPDGEGMPAEIDYLVEAMAASLSGEDPLQGSQPGPLEPPPNPVAAPTPAAPRPSISPPPTPARQQPPGRAWQEDPRAMPTSMM